MSIVITQTVKPWSRRDFKRVEVNYQETFFFAFPHPTIKASRLILLFR